VENREVGKKEKGAPGKEMNCGREKRKVNMFLRFCQSEKKHSLEVAFSNLEGARQRTTSIQKVERKPALY